MKSKGRNSAGMDKGYTCKVTKGMVEWLAMNAFRAVLGKRQSRYSGIIEWLDEKIRVLRMKDGEGCARMRGVVGGEGKHSTVLGE